VSAATSSWGPAPSSVALGRGYLHLWRAPLDFSPGELERLWLTLAPAERERAEHLIPLDVRRRFVASRGVLRAILGRYLGLPAAGVVLAVGPNGKPELAPSRQAPALWFNYSRSVELALFCVSGTGPVGVDVEYVQPDFDWEPVAALLGPGERDALDSLPVELRRAAFFRNWTRKEACLKAAGVGLGFPLDAFEVPVEPEHPPSVGSWWLRTCEPGAGYVGAVASEAPGQSLSFWDWKG
jgi:4'-phosphopantetheinyl transferase